jgi:hypothetical protein
MNKKLFAMLLCAGTASLQAVAQETYQDTKLVENELNGTARYVGMGGAMEALGADISTISSNPAGIGLFRKSQIAVSGGLVSQNDAETSFSYGGTEINFDGNKTNASFDQIGFVWAKRTGRRSFLNFAFNYHKSRNFDQILNAANSLSSASQNKLTALKYGMEATNYNWNGVDANYGYYNSDNSMSPLYYQETVNGETTTGMNYVNATQYLFGQYQKGYIGTYDFNISGNINDRVYLGITFGIHDVNYRSNSIYTEDLADGGSATTWETLKIDGTGFDVKFGAIFRPIEDSPFRIGAYVNTPIFYDLTQRNDADLSMDGTYNIESSNSADYDFKVYTPWKFGLSLGTTVGNYLALGATYEYSDYAGIDNRVNDGGYYDWYGEWYDSSSSDDVMNDHTDATLKGVHLLKLGMEVKPIDNFSIRAGYNFQSAIFDEDGFRDGSLESPGVCYATSTDYTNWKSTNRFTVGLGYQAGPFNIDLAYQYSQTNGTFYPFMSYFDDSDSSLDNVATSSDVNFKRNQLLLTLGYRF